jgi:Ni/Co efflux regulator RcnB
MKNLIIGASCLALGALAASASAQPNDQGRGQDRAQHEQRGEQHPNVQYHPSGNPGGRQWQGAPNMGGQPRAWQGAPNMGGQPRAWPGNQGYARPGPAAPNYAHPGAPSAPEAPHYGVTRTAPWSGRGGNQYNGQYNRQYNGQYNRQYNGQYNRQYNGQNNRQYNGQYNRQYGGRYNQQYNANRGDWRAHEGDRSWWSNNHWGWNGHRYHYGNWNYPYGYGYQRWSFGEFLPSIFLAPEYYFTDYYDLGFEAPPYGFQWVRYGPDLLLVNTYTGEVEDVEYGVFY